VGLSATNLQKNSREVATSLVVFYNGIWAGLSEHRSVREEQMLYDVIVVSIISTVVIAAKVSK